MVQSAEIILADALRRIAAGGPYLHGGPRFEARAALHEAYLLPPEEECRLVELGLHLADSLFVQHAPGYAGEPFAIVGFSKDEATWFLSFDQVILWKGQLVNVVGRPFLGRYRPVEPVWYRATRLE